MARTYARYMSPEDEEALLYGPPRPPVHPNLGVAPVPKLPIDEAAIEAARQRALVPTPDSGIDWDQVPETAPLTAEEMEKGGEDFDPAPVNRYDLATGAYGGLDLGGVANGLRMDDIEELLEGSARASEMQALDTAKTAAAAPRAVDKKAASVAAEQKGVPAAKLALTTDPDVELGWTDELLQNVRSRLINKPETSESPLNKTAEQVATDSLKPTEGFSREKQAALAQEAYGEDTPASSRWEDEFLRERGDDRLTDAQIRRRAAAIGLISGLTTGDTEAGSRWADQQRRSNQDYAEGRGKARDRDKLETRIPRGLASAIAATGMVPPAEAVKLTYGDPLVKAFSSGMYSQGGRAEGQAMGWQKAQLHEAAEIYKSGKSDDRMRVLAQLSSLTQFGTAEIRAQALAMLSPEDQQRLAASWMQSGLKPLGANLTPEKAAAVLEGDRSGLTPEQAAKADALTPNIKTGVADPRVRASVTSDNLKAGVNADQKTENKVRDSILLAENDRDKALEWQGKWRAAEMPLKEGIAAWRKMSPKAKEAFATLSTRGEIVDQLAKFAMYGPGEQELASKVLAVINAQVKADAGSAVTGSEWDRIAYRVGIPTGTWAPFNDPKVVETYLMDAAKLMTESRKDYERIMGGWK